MSDVTTDPALVAGAATDLAQQAELSSPRERHSLTLDQRRELRRWANSHPNRPSHKACIDWFFSQYGHQISQSTVSHSLSPKYSRLDGDNPQLSGSRLRFGNWPDVEKIVLDWYRHVLASGRQPTNDELGEKAKTIFAQLPRYREENAPEFSPGWIHRFKKRYGLLVRRQRRLGDGGINPAEDIEYLADCIPRVMAVAPNTSPAAIREQVLRVVGVEASLTTCALVRDEVIRKMSAIHQPPRDLSESPAIPPTQHEQPNMYSNEDPEVVLQNALRQLQQEEQAAEDMAAAAREERDRAERGEFQQPEIEATPGGQASPVPRYATPGQDITQDLTLTPIHSDVPVSSNDKPIRCPFCVNHRMLRTIKEAVEHMSTHVVV